LYDDHALNVLLQAVEQMKEIQSSTQAALRDQGEQMRRIETDMDKVCTTTFWLFEMLWMPVMAMS
jgi:hypothetical protein